MSTVKCFVQPFAGVSRRITTTGSVNPRFFVSALSFRTLGTRTSSPNRLSVTPATTCWTGRLPSISKQSSVPPSISTIRSFASSSGGDGDDDNVASSEAIASEANSILKGLNSSAEKKKAREERRAARLEKKKAKAEAALNSTSNNPVSRAWIEFQKDIAVEGFDTGQKLTTEVEKKQRKRKLTRRQKLAVAANHQASLPPKIGAGEFPALRFSDEETARLLKEAYDNRPPRAGKRGTNNLRRQRNRWFQVRKIHKKRKRNRIRAHFRRMEKRARISQERKAIMEIAPSIRERDRAYQAWVLAKWKSQCLGFAMPTELEVDREEEQEDGTILMKKVTYVNPNAEYHNDDDIRPSGAAPRQLE